MKKTFAWMHRFQYNPRRCSRPGCNRFHAAKGLCKLHYDQLAVAEKRIKQLEAIINDTEMFPK